MKQLLKWGGPGQEDSSTGGVFFFRRWPSSTIEGKAEGAGFSVRLQTLNSATTSTHSHVPSALDALRRGILQGDDDT